MIDTTKCFCCKQGIPLFRKKNDLYEHVDLFATKEAGAIYSCENTATIGEYLIEKKGAGTYLPKSEWKQFFMDQELWWGDMLQLLYEVFTDQKTVTAFINEGKEGSRNWSLPDQELENKLLAHAENKNILVDEETFPFLLKWKSTQQNTPT